MLEGIQQTYPGVGAYPPPTIPQGGFNNPLGGAIGAGVPGLFGNGGLGRQLDPLTQAYLQQAQLTQQLGPQGIFGGNGVGSQQWSVPRVPIDSILVAYIQQIVQHQIAQLLGPQVPFGQQNTGQIGRQPFGVDPMTLALLQQTQQQQFQQQQPPMGYGGQQFGGSPFGGSPFGRPPLQSHIGAGAYGPLSGW